MDKIILFFVFNAIYNWTKFPWWVIIKLNKQLLIWDCKYEVIRYENYKIASILKMFMVVVPLT